MENLNILSFISKDKWRAVLFLTRQTRQLCHSVLLSGILIVYSPLDIYWLSPLAAANLTVFLLHSFVSIHLFTDFTVPLFLRCSWICLLFTYVFDTSDVCYIFTIQTVLSPITYIFLSVVIWPRQWKLHLYQKNQSLALAWTCNCPYCLRISIWLSKYGP